MMVTVTVPIEVKRLFDLVLDFVADHIQLVDSFHGFPEIIGKQICDKVIDRKLTQIQSFSQEVFSIVNLFLKAYSVETLTMLNLERSQLLTKSSCASRLSNALVAQSRLHMLATISHAFITQLDISYCSYCIEPDALTLLGKCSSLTHLRMSHVGLIDSSLLHLLAATSVTKQGLISLTHLDVAGNFFTNQSVKKFRCLAKLEMINLTDTLITDAGCKELPGFIRDFDLHMVRIENIGWLANEIHRLANCQIKSTGIKKRKFYSSGPEAHSQDLCLSQSRLVLVRPLCDGSSETARNKAQLRMQAAPRKGKPSAGDWVLLNQYR